MFLVNKKDNINRKEDTRNLWKKKKTEKRGRKTTEGRKKKDDKGRMKKQKERQRKR